ncbi:MAG: hypothetical protein Q9171_003543 [Xanthocarpia ochracea]
MSGLEVAGVVLGSVPVILSALDNYKTSRNLWRRMKMTAMHIEELIEEIQETQALVESKLELLLQMIHADGAQPGDNMIKRLRRKDVAPDMESFMGNLYKPFGNALRRYEDILQRILNKLGGLIFESNQGRLMTLGDVADAQSRLNGHYTFLNRIKFSVKKDELVKLIAVLKQSRQDLDTIARAHLDKEIALSNPSPDGLRSAGFFDQIQRHAADLYSSIHATLGGKCHSYHAARLLLNSWSEAISTRRRPRIAFEVAFASGPEPAVMEHCKGFSIEILPEDVDEQGPDQ